MVLGDSTTWRRESRSLIRALPRSPRPGPFIPPGTHNTKKTAHSWSVGVSGFSNAINPFTDRRCTPACCRSRTVNRNLVTSHILSLLSALKLLLFPFNERRDSLHHGIPFKIFRVVPSLSRFCCHFSPRYGILPL